MFAVIGAWGLLYCQASQWWVLCLFPSTVTGCSCFGFDSLNCLYCMYLLPDRLSSLSDTVYKQSCQLLRFGRSWLRTILLCSWSYYSALPPKNIFLYFQSLVCVWASNAPATSCECAFFVHVVLVVPYWHPHFKPADQLQCSVQFPLLCITSWRDNFCFIHFKWPYWSELPGDKSHQKTTHQTLQEEYVYRKVSVHCTTSAEHPACEVQCWILGTFMLPMVECMMSSNWKHHINKGKAVGSTLKISHFMGCETLSSQYLDVIWVEMLFTNFFVAHIALSAAKC